MGFIFNEVFWGILLIIFGVGVIINVVFHVNIPIWRVVFAFVLIYIGVRLMMGRSFQWEGNWERPQNMTIFQGSHVPVDKTGGEYTVVFGEGNYDMADVSPVEGGAKVKFNTIFGNSVLRLNPNLPYKIVSTAVFAGAQMPDGSNSWFGDHVYQSKNFREDRPYVSIKADVIFGGLEVLEDPQIGNTIENNPAESSSERIH